MLVIFAVALFILSIYSVNKAFSSLGSNASISKAELENAQIIEKPMQELVLAEVAKKLQNEFLQTPISVVAKKNEITITVRDAENFPEWESAVHKLPSLDRSVIWKAKEICVGEGCPEGAAAYIAVEGKTFSVEKSNK